MNRFFLAAFLICLGACGDATGPEPPAGRLLAPGTLALEWSADGAEIYQYGNGRFAMWPDRIIAVNVSTGATRIVVDSCASGGGGGRPVPPRATIAGDLDARTRFHRRDRSAARHSTLVRHLASTRF